MYFTEAKRASSSQSIFCEGFDRPELLRLFQRHLVVCLTCVWAKVLRPLGEGREGWLGVSQEAVTHGSAVYC